MTVGPSGLAAHQLMLASGVETRAIGSLQASVVGLGCNNFGTRLDPDATGRVVQAAIDEGINFFDTADIYGQGKSEEYLGRALGKRRQQVLIATKYGKPMGEGKRGARPEYIRFAVEASLRRLGTDYIDLYQQHEPDPRVPIEETLGVLAELKREGLVREVGASNFDEVQLEEAEAAGRRAGVRFVSLQNEYSLLRRDSEKAVLAECERLGIAFIPFYPLASGLLSGKYRKGKELPEGTRLTSGNRGSRFLTDENLDKVERLATFAESRGHTLLELAFSWLLVRPVVASVIAGASNPEQVRANARAADWALTPEDLREVDDLLA